MSSRESVGSFRLENSVVVLKLVDVVDGDMDGGIMVMCNGRHLISVRNLDYFLK